MCKHINVLYVVENYSLPANGEVVGLPKKHAMNARRVTLTSRSTLNGGRN